MFRVLWADWEPKVTASRSSQAAMRSLTNTSRVLLLRGDFSDKTNELLYQNVAEFIELSAEPLKTNSSAAC